MFLGAKMLAQASSHGTRGAKELMHFSKLFWTGKGAPEHQGKMSDGGGGETAASHSLPWSSEGWVNW